MSAVLCPLSLQTVADLAGRPQLGATCLVYAAGTLTEATVYSDAGLATPLQQPVKVTGSGRLPPMYLGAGAFRFRVFDNRGGLLDDVDGIQGADATDTTTPAVAFSMPTGAIQALYSTNCPDGWVRANGNTIGGPTSGATEFGDLSALALYVLLWNADPNLVVTGSRGVTATADFQAGKPMALPDLRRAVLVGLDSVGAAALGGAAAFSTLGVRVGEETHSLVIAEGPGHIHEISATTSLAGDHTHAASTAAAGGFTPSVSIAAAGGHTHAASTDQQGQHNHAGTTDNVGDHNHIYNYDTYQTAPTFSASGQASAYAGVQRGQPSTGTAGAHTHHES